MKKIDQLKEELEKCMIQRQILETNCKQKAELTTETEQPHESKHDSKEIVKRDIDDEINNALMENIKGSQANYEPFVDDENSIKKDESIKEDIQNKYETKITHDLNYEPFVDDENSIQKESIKEDIQNKYETKITHDLNYEPFVDDENSIQKDDSIKEDIQNIYETKITHDNADSGIEEMMSDYFNAALDDEIKFFCGTHIWVTGTSPEKNAQAFENLGLALVTILAGFIVDQYGYVWLERFFMANLAFKFDDLISGIRIGPEPTTDSFVVVKYDEREGLIPGNALVVDPKNQFKTLAKFGNNFLSKFQCSQVNSSVLKHITIVDTPGILAGDKQLIDRGYDFAGVIEWFAERADRIIILFDAHKLDISDELRRSIEGLRRHDDKIHIVLNKADMIDHQQLMRVYGALMWSLGKCNFQEEGTMPPDPPTLLTVFIMFSFLSKNRSKNPEVFENVVEGLKVIYNKKLLPLEQAYNFHEFHSPTLTNADFEAKPMILLIGQFHFHEFHSPTLTNADFEAKPMILLIGQYSTGKTTFIKYLLERDFPDFSGVSLWDQPFRYDLNRKLFEDEEQDLFKDLQTLPKNAIIRKLNDVIKRARLAKVHAFIIGALRAEMPSTFGKSNKKRELIKSLNVIYAKLQREHRISPGDFPDIRKMQELLELQDFSKFNYLKPRLIEIVDKTLTEDIGRLIPIDDLTPPSNETAVEGGAFEGMEDVITPQREHRISPGDFPDIRKMQELLELQDFSKFNYLKPRLIEIVDKTLTEDIGRLIPIDDLTPPSNETAVEGGAFEGMEDVITPFSNRRSEYSLEESEWCIAKEKYDLIFNKLAPNNGKITGTVAKAQMMKSKLPNSVLGKVWKLSDIDQDGYLDSDEFAVAMHLISKKLEGHELPNELPPSLLPPARRKRQEGSNSSKRYEGNHLTEQQKQLNKELETKFRAQVRNGPQLQFNSHHLKREFFKDVNPNP
ncbi:LOW QUALITY PROTEIN: EH domain-containing protein 1-like [Diaphorina citri]|uniref:LOW QUALITY PROTEIN: EH domain-containing protein 1-like n=1 Tax=Diaphorina citri TaxID=121845 RepID=A0A3Q0IRW7_DIACI|nr:LOW QUALITY PROTEIN: EH domain-containing protein 1-like [Diaphorina citri]